MPELTVEISEAAREQIEAEARARDSSREQYIRDTRPGAGCHPGAKSPAERTTRSQAQSRASSRR